MANYFRRKKGKRDEDVFYSEKPRSRSLDPRSLELSGIRLVAHYHQHHIQVTICRINPCICDFIIGASLNNLIL